METVVLVLALILAAAVALVLIRAALKPTVFRIERSTLVAAPPERIQGLVADLAAFQTWSPWAKLDPAMSSTLSGARSGVGAVYTWRGDKRVGEGRMEVKENVPGARTVIALDFLKPFEAHNVAEFTFRPTAAGTAVAWAMTGPHPFLFRVMATLFDIDGRIGRDFENGLAALKARAEGGEV